MSDIELDGFINYPLDDTREKHQVRDRTAGGQLQVEDLGVPTIRQIPLNLVLLDQSTKAAILDLWDNFADGALNTFTYTDKDANNYTVRMLTNPYRFPEDPPGRYSGTLLLEVES